MPYRTSPATVSLTLSVDEANTLLSMVGSPPSSSEPSSDPVVAREEALVTSLHTTLGDFLIAQGGDTALPVQLSRASSQVFALSDAEADLRRYTASDKLSHLADSFNGLADVLRYPSEADYLQGAYFNVHEAFNALGNATRAKVPAAVVSLVESIPAGTDPDAGCDACSCA